MILYRQGNRTGDDGDTELQIPGLVNALRPSAL